MRIDADGFAEIEPVFGILSGGALVLDPSAGVFRTIPADSYRMVDDRASAWWAERDGGFAFPEFFEPYFTENLAHKAPRECFVVECWRELFDREHPRDDLPRPEYFGRGLVMCPVCGTIFEPLSFLGVVRCTGRECRAEMNNPFYDREHLNESIEWKRLSHLVEHRNRYFCVKTRKYYPVPPTNWSLFCEALSERLKEMRRRREERRRKYHKRW